MLDLADFWRHFGHGRKESKWRKRVKPEDSEEKRGGEENPRIPAELA